MKRYSVQVNIKVSANNKKEAAQILKEIVESGQYVKDGKFLIVRLFDKPVVEELPF